MFHGLPRDQRMDDLIARLSKLTADFLSTLNDADVVSIERFIEERDKLIGLMKQHSNPQISAQQKSIIQALLQCDTVILGRMELLKNEASQKLKSVQQASSQRNAYDDNTPADESYFFDRRR